MSPVAGAYPLTAVAKLPNATITFPGEIWSNCRADGNIVPGAAVRPTSVGGKLTYKQIVALDTPDIDQVGVALRQVEHPDVNSGPNALGPNEIVNQLIASGDYLRVKKAGALAFTLCEPRADYTPGQKIGWAPGAARPAGKAAGTGAWSNTGIIAGTAIFEATEYRSYGGSDEGVLNVRFLRANN